MFAYQPAGCIEFTLVTVEVSTSISDFNLLYCVSKKGSLATVCNSVAVAWLAHRAAQG